MLFAKIKEKLLNRRNDIEISEIKDSKGNVIDLEELVNNPSIIVGYYIYNSEKEKFQLVDDIPEDYSGYVITIGDDGFMTTAYYENGTLSNQSSMSPQGVDKIDATDGTPTKVYGEDADGNLVKGAVSGGTKLYRHQLTLSGYPTIKEYTIDDTTGEISVTSETPSYASKTLYLITSSSAEITTLGNFPFVQGSAALGTSSYILLSYNKGLGSNLNAMSFIKINYTDITITEDVVTEL